MSFPDASEVELPVQFENGKAVITGKTNVPFKTFVSLIIQRKVSEISRRMGDEPVVVSSELLTGLASAPQDNADNRAQLVLVSLGAGVIVGTFIVCLLQAVLLTVEVVLPRDAFALAAGVILLGGMTVHILSRVRKRNRSDKIVEGVEKLAAFLGK